MTTTFSPRFYRAAAICSMASAITTLCLIFLPRLYPPVADFDDRMALGSHWAYQWRSWVYLFHPFLVFTAALAVAMRVRRQAAGAAALGLAGFALWATTEAAQQTLTKVALDRTWRAAWPTAESAVREVIRQHVAFYDVVWDSMYLLLLIGFLVGNVLLALAVGRASRERGPRVLVAPGMAGIVSWAFAAAAALTLLLLLPEFGGPTVAGTGWLYPLIQPAGRALIGAWLWREASRLE
jgi:hypothetical protein